MADFYRTENFKTNPSSFGGIIYNYDFDSCLTISDMARRILSDLRFDEQCRKISENRERNKKHGK